MRTQRRERAAAKLIEKQKTVSDRRRIHQALEKVRSEAEAARRSLHTKIGGDGRHGDSVCSHATKSNGRPKMVSKQQTQVPVSDITNNFYDCSIDNASRTLCSDTLATSTESESIATKNSVGIRKSMRAAALTEGVAADENDCDVASSNLKLDTRREWELAPLQDVLHRFAFDDEIFQELIDTNALECTFPGKMFRLKRQQSLEIRGTLLNRGLPIRAVIRRANAHSAVSLCLRDYTFDDDPRPHSGRKNKEACDKHAPLRAEHAAKIVGVAPDTNKESPSSVSENFRIDEKLRSLSSNPNYGNPTVFDISKISLQIESDGNFYTFPEGNEAGVFFIGDSNANNEEKADGSDELTLKCCEEYSDDEYESSFLSED